MGQSAQRDEQLPVFKDLVRKDWQRSGDEWSPSQRERAANVVGGVGQTPAVEAVRILPLKISY